jgi:uncharacterized DUF497 family protein
LGDFDYRWDEEKNIKLKKDRHISFEEIVNVIKNDKVLEVIKNPSSNFDNQECYVIELNNYIYLVPYVKNGNEKFLKTIFPSRKHKKIYIDKRK